MDTKDAGRMGGLKGGKSKSGPKVSASRANLEKARQSRWPQSANNTHKIQQPAEPRQIMSFSK